MPDITDLQERRRLGQELRGIREQTGLSGNQFAKRLGWHQTRVSKIELGQQFPTEEDIRAWVGAAGDTGAVTRLLALRDAAQMAYRTFRQQYRDAGGAAGRQADIAAMEAMAGTIGHFEPAIIPGRLQTFGYALETLRLPSGPASWGASEEEIQLAAQTRVERQQQILYDKSKRIRVVLLESVLHTRLCSPDTMYGQLDRLLSLDGLPSLELGIIPFGVQVPVFPLSGFIVYDDHLVIVETLTGEQQLSDHAEVSRYVEWLDLLRGAAVTGAGARPLIRRALDGLGDSTTEPGA